MAAVKLLYREKRTKARGKQVVTPVGNPVRENALITGLLRVRKY